MRFNQIDIKHITKYLYPFISGILLALPWNGMSGIIMLLGWIPYFFYIEYTLSSKAKTIELIFPTLIFCGTWNFMATWWSYQVTFLAPVATIVVNGGIATLVLLLFYSARKRHGFEISYLFFIPLWICYEYIQLNWDLNFPWLNLGNAFAGDTILIQWYEYTGTLGGSLWILVVNTLVIKLIFAVNTDSKKKIVTTTALLFVALSVPVITSVVLHKGTKHNAPFNVLIIQPNFDPYLKTNIEEYEIKFQDVLTSISGDTISNLDIIIAPESFIKGSFFFDSLLNNKQLLMINNFLVKYKKTAFLFGANTLKETADITSLAVRYDTLTHTYYKAYNSLICINKDRETTIHNKVKLFPGTEKTPFGEHISFLSYLTVNIGSATGDLGVGKTTNNIVINDNIIIAPLICWESVFGNYVRTVVKTGANAIVLITNDGWWRNTPGTRMHYKLANLRAIENRRPVIRAANTGISSLINQYGEVTQLLDYGINGSLRGKITPNNDQTFYTKYGDIIGVTSSIITILFMVLFASSYLIEKKNFHKKL